MPVMVKRRVKEKPTEIERLQRQRATIGEWIDAYWRIVKHRRELAQRVEEVKQEEHKFEAAMLEQFASQHIEKATGRRAMATVSIQTVANIVDWNKLCRYITREQAFDLLNKRLTIEAVRDRLEQGVSEETMGVKTDNLRRVKVTPRKQA